LANLCEDEKIPTISKIMPTITDYNEIKIGQPREKVKEEVCIEALYDPESAKAFKL
jgi:hypothetical protein